MGHGGFVPKAARVRRMDLGGLFYFAEVMDMDQMITAARERVRNRRALPAPAMRRQIRESAGLSRVEMATLLGTNSWNVVAYELGRSTPRGEKLEQYVEILRRLSAPEF